MKLLEPLKLRFTALVTAMSARDRKLFVGLVVAFYVGVLGLFWWVASGAVGDERSRISLQEEKLALLKSLAEDQGATKSQVERIEAKLKEYKGQDLPSFIEKAASNTGVSANLQGVREKKHTTEGDLEETSYTVDLSKVSLQQLTEFLYEIETKGYPLKVRTLKTRVQTVAGAKLLTVNIELSSFSLVASEEAAPAEKPG